MRQAGAAFGSCGQSGEALKLIPEAIADMNIMQGKFMRKVLFLCYANACRSIMAEALARHFMADRVEASSAGLDPGGYIPDFTLKVLEEAGISTDGLYSKGFFSLLLGDIDYLVNLTKTKVERFIPRSFTGDLIYCPVRDPFGQDIESYRATREEITRLIRQKLPELIGVVSDGR